MKAKTVWVEWHKQKRRDLKHWLLMSKAVFRVDSDARWLNIYGYEYGGEALEEESKIIGDE